MLIVPFAGSTAAENSASSVQHNPGVHNALGKSLSSREMLRIHEEQW